MLILQADRVNHQMAPPTYVVAPVKHMCVLASLTFVCGVYFIHDNSNYVFLKHLL